MLARFFYRSEPISFISLLVLTIFWVLGSQELSWSNSYHISGTLVLFVGFLFLIDFIIQKYHLTPVNYYAVFIFTLLLGAFPSVLKLNKILISFLLILLITYKVFSFRKKENTIYKLFDAGFIMGISYLIYPISIVYFLFIYIGYFLYIKIIDKRLFIPIVGFFIPVFLAFSYLYFFDKTSIFNNLTELNISVNFNWIYNHKFSIPLIILGVYLLFFIVKIISLDTLSNLEEEQNYKMVIAHFILSWVIIILTGLNAKESVLFLFFSVAILLGNSLNRTKKWWLKEIVFYSLLGTAIVLFTL